MNVFRRVGQEVGYGDSLLTLADIQPIHDLAMTETLLAAKAGNIVFSDNHDKVTYSFYFRPIDEFEQGWQDRHVTVQAAHEQIPDNWRLAVSLRSYTQANRYSNKLIRYYHEVLGGDIMQAKKAVYLVLGNVAMFAGDKDMSEQVTTERKTYERHMTKEDCDVVTEMLLQTARRAAISR